MRKFNENILRDYFDEKDYKKSFFIFQNGNVFVTDNKSVNRVVGYVLGTKLYTTTLGFKPGTRDELKGTCTCPYFKAYQPCKHIAALGLVIVKGIGKYRSNTRVERMYKDMQEDKTTPMYKLMKKDKKELVQFIIDLVKIRKEYAGFIDS